jgi:hypothetical protein
MPEPIIPDSFFMDRPEGVDWAERFAVLGRALFIASRLESSARAVAFHVGVRLNPSSAISGTENRHDALSAFIQRLYSRQLNSNLQAIRKQLPQIQNLEDTLTKAREARNELIHEAARGFDWRVEDIDEASKVWSHVTALVRAIAQADLLLSTLESVFNRDSLPSDHSLSTYVDELVAWVIGDAPYSTLNRDSSVADA